MDNQIKLVLVDDHNLVTEAWTALLSQEPNIVVLGSTNSADSALELCLKMHPDVVLMDINLKESNGLEATRMICNQLAKTKVIGLSLHDDIAIVKRLIANGAKGYLSKNSSKSELLEAIETVCREEIYLSTDIRNRFYMESLAPNDLPPKPELTMREIEIVKDISNGLSSKVIADKLFVSIRTVETHRHNILKKLDLQNAAQLSSWARENGYF